MKGHRILNRVYEAQLRREEIELDPEGSEAFRSICSEQRIGYWPDLCTGSRHRINQSNIKQVFDLIN